MYQEDRLQKIAEMVKQKKYCSINELSAEFNISKATVRRDLKILDSRKILRISRGGAVDAAFGTAKEPSYIIKKDLNHEEKIRIANKACSYIKSGETIILDSGTTAFEIAGLLESMEDITVATNDILVAGRLVNAKGIDLTVIGGSIRKHYYSTAGYLAQFALEHINADKAFIGVDALDLKKGCMITNMEEVIIKKLIMKSAKEKIVICDHSKFEEVAFVNLCMIHDVDMIITGKEIDKSVYSSFVEAGVNIVLS